MPGNAVRRVPIVIRPLDRAFTLMKVALIPALLFAAGIPTLKALTGAGSASGVVGVGALAVTYIVVLQTHTVEQRVDRLVSLLRRRVALSCDHDYLSTHHDGFACHLTAEALRAPLLRYDAQHAAVTALAEACNADAQGQFWFVEGGSGSGKTRTAFLLVQTLVRDLRHFELGSRCYLYDFAEADHVQNVLLRRLGSPSHDGVVVLVDNFQLVRADVLRVITARLMDRPGRLPEQLVVFLARPGDAWNLSPGADVRILSEAKGAQHHVKLFGPSSEDVTRRVGAIDAEAAMQLRSLNDGAVATAAQLHFAQVIVRNAGVPDDVRDILSLLAGDKLVVRDDLLRSLGVVSAMSVHRGGFRRSELRMSAALSTNGPRWRQLWEAARALRDLRRLRRLGLITKLTVGGTRFVFHEAIAELCVDNLSGMPSFDDAFQGVAGARLVALTEAGDVLGTWLIGAEVGAQDVLAETFDAAMSRGAYSRMARCLRRVAERHHLTVSSNLQLAILLDRTGDFPAARALIARTRSAPSASGRLAAMLTAQLIEAGHDERSLEDAAALRGHSDRDIALVGEYWELHIAAHRGEFAPERLLELASEMAGLSGDRGGYWPVHAISRMHFDSLRHHYLTGGLPVEAPVCSKRQKLDAVLSGRLPTFEALHILYAKAHFVGHVLLPRLALLGESVSSEHVALAGLGNDDVRSVDGLTHAAEQLYHRARDEFWQYGDREAGYLQADVLNASMIQAGADLETLKTDLQAYERFIEESGFDDIRSYPQLYFVRWHVLRHFASLLGGGVAQDAPGRNSELDEAAQRLESAIAFDTVADNAYGLHRAEFLGILLKALSAPFDRDGALKLAQRMRGRRYGFEAELLTHLATLNRIPISTLFATVRFYPIVHQ